MAVPPPALREKLLFIQTSSIQTVWRQLYRGSGSMRYSLSVRYAVARSKSRRPPWRLEIAPDHRAIEKPDTENGSAEAVHPEATAYYDNNEIWISKFKSSVRDLGAFRKRLSSRALRSQ